MPNAEADKLVDSVVGWTLQETLNVVNRGPTVQLTRIEISGPTSEEVMAKADEEMAKLAESGTPIVKHCYIILHR